VAITGVFESYFFMNANKSPFLRVIPRQSSFDLQRFCPFSGKKKEKRGFSLNQESKGCLSRQSQRIASRIGAERL
jgi:hypothetical protein